MRPYIAERTGARHLAVAHHPPHARPLSRRAGRSPVAPRALGGSAPQAVPGSTSSTGRSPASNDPRWRLPPNEIASRLLCALIFSSACCCPVTASAQTVECVADGWASDRICADPDLLELERAPGCAASPGGQCHPQENFAQPDRNRAGEIGLTRSTPAAARPTPSRVSPVASRAASMPDLAVAVDWPDRPCRPIRPAPAHRASGPSAPKPASIPSSPLPMSAIR